MPDGRNRSDAIVRRNGAGLPSDTVLNASSRRWLSQKSGGAVRRLQSFAEKLSVDRQWPRALRAVALARDAEAGNAEAQRQLAVHADGLLADSGNWRSTLRDPSQALDGYAVLMLHRIAPSSRYESALKIMADHFVRNSPRLDGCLPYSAGGKLMLVDTLGMLCPFLAAYGRDFADGEAASLANAQLLSFIKHNLDPDSRLPFHGYFAGGPYRLGMHAWGRGVGWYMMGLADTLVELDRSVAAHAELSKALSEATRSLATFQRPDGNWNWVVVLANEQPDTSVASFCGYALARAQRAKLISGEFASMTERALAALNAATAEDGTVGQSSGECRGLTSYSSSFGPQIWTQATAAAFVIEMNKFKGSA